MYKPTIGKDRLHENSNDNGTRLINMAMSKELVISRTYFPCKNIHKHTWISKNELTKNQIDLIDSDKLFKANVALEKSFFSGNIFLTVYTV